MFLPAQGAALGARYLVEALDRGDAFHQTLALSAEAAFMGSLGMRHARRAERALTRARQLAGAVTDPVVHGFIDSAAALGAMARGEFTQMRDLCQNALGHIRRFGTRFAWEASTSQAFLALARFYLGEMAALRNELPELSKQAERGGNLLLDAMLHGGAGTLLLLVQDRPDQAERQLARLRTRFPQGSPLLQNALLTMTTGMLHAYRADAGAAYCLVDGELPTLQRAGLLRMPLLSMGLWFLLGASAASLSRERPQQARALLRRAHLAAKRLGRVPARPALAMQQCLRALLSLHQGRPHAARVSLREAAARFRALHMLPFALIAERAQAELALDAEDRRGVERADRTLAELGVAQPARFANLLLPSISMEVPSR